MLSDREQILSFYIVEGKQINLDKIASTESVFLQESVIRPNVTSAEITMLKRTRALSAFRTFIRFVLVWICRFPLPFGVWEGLRFVIVVLPGLSSYLFSATSRKKYLMHLMSCFNFA